MDSAFRLLIIHQYLAADDPMAAANDALRRHPSLRAHCYTNELLQHIAEFGFVDVY
jgi:hypothetical protein